MGDLLFLRRKSGGICGVCYRGPQVLISVGDKWMCAKCIELGIEYAAKEAHLKRTDGSKPEVK